MALAAAALAGLVAVPGVARSQATEMLLSASDAVFRYEHALHAEHVDEVRVNGLGFRVASGATTDGLAVVLDRFESLCAKENADVRSEKQMLRRIGPRKGFEGTLRAERDGRGAVACLGRSAGAREKTLAERLHGFLVTADVAEIGPIRLFFASSAPGHTSYVALTSEGSLPLLRAFPGSGDAPGRDPSGPPRPSGAVRRLSAWAPGSTASVAVYETPKTDPALALSRYRNALSAAGFEVSAPSEQGEHVLARMGTRAVLASVVRANDDGALVTIVAL